MLNKNSNNLQYNKNKINRTSNSLHSILTSAIFVLQFVFTTHLRARSCWLIETLVKHIFRLTVGTAHEIIKKIFCLQINCTDVSVILCSVLIVYVCGCCWYNSYKMSTVLIASCIVRLSENLVWTGLYFNQYLTDKTVTHCSIFKA